MALHEKTAALRAKLQGRAPHCPWISALRCLHPLNFKVRPPQHDCHVVHQDGEMFLLQFANRHSFWFPSTTPTDLELWNEYLAVFWNHPANAHYYLRGGVNIGINDVVYDCGACEGFFTRLALDAGAPCVVCIEPSEVMADCLKRTFADEIRNGRVRVCNLALSSICGRGSFDQQPGEAFSGKLSSTGLHTAEIATLDSLSSSLPKPSVLKMDLEGMEYEALRGGAKLLEDTHPSLAVTTYHYPWDFEVNNALVTALGYGSVRSSAAVMRQSAIPRVVMLNAR
jgi:FkbM family methyltransferase